MENDFKSNEIIWGNSWISHYVVAKLCYNFLSIFTLLFTGTSVIGAPNKTYMNEILLENFPYAMGIIFNETFSYKLTYLQGYNIPLWKEDDFSGDFPYQIYYGIFHVFCIKNRWGWATEMLSMTHEKIKKAHFITELISRSIVCSCYRMTAKIVESPNMYVLSTHMHVSKGTWVTKTDRPQPQVRFQFSSKDRHWTSTRKNVSWALRPGVPNSGIREILPGEMMFKGRPEWIAGVRC